MWAVLSSGMKVLITIYINTSRIVSSKNEIIVGKVIFNLKVDIYSDHVSYSQKSSEAENRANPNSQ